MTDPRVDSAAPLRILPSGSGAILVELPDLADTMALLADLQAEPLHGVLEMVAGARTLSLRFDPHVTSATDLTSALALRRLRPPRPESQRTVEIPVRYDGEDLAEVARLTGLSETEVIRRHTQSPWTVAFGGFAPGFAYLSGGDPALDVPRRKAPRTRIPAGAVALAGCFSGVYPTASPGGWQIIGTTPVRMWDLTRQPPALLSAGDRVRFVEISDTKYAEIAAQTQAAPLSADAAHMIGAQGRLTVTKSPFPILLQDAGRSGQTAQGVSASGVMDLGALRSLNRMLGNPPDCAALEITGGASFRIDAPAVLAVAGAPCGITINSTLRLPSHQPIALDAGDEVTLSPPASGVRALLGLRGGFKVEPVLGSLATDTLAGLGPAPLACGDSLALADAPAIAVGDPEPAADLPRAGETVTLDILLGPRADAFTPEMLALLTGQEWEVSQQSSRVGLRLNGAQPLLRDDATELPSEGTVRGAIQVPHSGQPVLFMADHPLTGGYPVIGVVAAHHLDLAAQIPPGARIRFRPLAPFAEIGAFELERSL